MYGIFPKIQANQPSKYELERKAKEKAVEEERSKKLALEDENKRKEQSPSRRPGGQRAGSGTRGKSKEDVKRN